MKEKRIFLFAIDTDMARLVGALAKTIEDAIVILKEIGKEMEGKWGGWFIQPSRNSFIRVLEEWKFLEPDDFDDDYMDIIEVHFGGDKVESIKLDLEGESVSPS